MIISLIDMETGEEGVVVELEGGHNFTARIQNMGIRVGKKIKKTGSHLWRGPQTVEVDNFKVAIGHGMAKKVLVEVKR